MLYKNKLIIIILSAILSSNLAYSQEQKPTNVILIAIDALRPDHLGCYGYKKDISPNIDRIAKESVVFTQAISQASITPASIASVFTACYPTKHKVLHLVFKEDGRAEEKIPSDYYLYTIAEALKNNNYLTANFFANCLLPYMELGKKGIDYSYDCKFGKNYYYISKAENITKHVISWISSRLQYPKYLYIHYIDTHWPCYTLFQNKPLFYNNKEKLIVPVIKNKDAFGGIPQRKVIKGIRDVNYYIALYDAKIRYVDEQIGILIDYLREKDMYNNSIIIIIADHGEAFGEHNLYLDHAHTLYDELLRVPLIIKLPQQAFGGKVVQRQVRLIDIMPTILGYLGLSIPKDIDGESLMPLINEKGKYNGKFSFSKTDVMNAIRSEEWKLIYDEDNNLSELYNLRQDPGELTNLFEQEAGILKVLKEEINRYLITPACYGGDLEDVDAKTKEMLRSLGYMQ